MIKMKKAQLSFEFILLFTILLFFFVSVAYLMLISGGTQENALTKKIADNLAKEIKVRFITASLSVIDFNSSMIIPTDINYVGLNVSFHKDPDNLVLIKNIDSGELIARAFLPVIDDVITNGIGQVKNISVIKNAANELIVYVNKE
jgi:hypothetical protein